MSGSEVIDIAPAPAAAAPPSLNDRTGARARKLRKVSGLTLKEIAERMGTTPQTVQRLETGNMTVSLDWVEAYATALGVPVLIFFSGSGTPADAVEECICREVERRVAMTTRTLATWLRDHADTLDQQPSA